MANVKFYSEEIEDGTVSIGYEEFQVKGHVLEVPEEVAAEWTPGPLWEPHEPKKRKARKEVKSDDGEIE